MKLPDLLTLNTVIQCNARTDMEKVFTILDELGLKQGVDILPSDEFINNYYKQKKMEESKKTEQCNRYIRVDDYDSTTSITIKGNIAELASLLSIAAGESSNVKSILLLAAGDIVRDSGKAKLADKLTQLAIEETIKSFT